MSNLLALDIGEKRIGVAKASSAARLPSPLTTLAHTSTVFDDIASIISTEGITTVIVGLPVNSMGEDTTQTSYTRGFVEKLKEKTDVEIQFQDEAFSSKRAENELAERRKPYRKEDIDALAAALILEDYLREKI